MRLMLALAAILAAGLAGCAGEGAGHDTDSWTFTERSSEDDAGEIGRAEGFDVGLELDASAGMRQIGGQWHGALAANAPFTIRVDASVDMILEWRAVSGAAGASGRCDWGPEGATKDVALGFATMSNTTTSCTLRFAPNAELASKIEPALRWEARSREPQPNGWTLRFEAARD